MSADATAPTPLNRSGDAHFSAPKTGEQRLTALLDDLPKLLAFDGFMNATKTT